MALTKKQKLFVEEYLIDLNATQAAIRAGYSEKRASEMGYQLLQKTTVSEEIQKRMKDRQQRTEITQDRVLQELEKIGFADVTDFVTIRGGMVQIKSTAEMPADKIGAIAGIKEGANGIEIKLNDKGKALELIGRHLGMFKDNLSVDIQTSKKFDDIISQLGGEGLEE